MKVKTIVIFNVFLLFSLLSAAQDNYKQGYFIKNNGTVQKCLINDRDWNTTPQSFTYKLEEIADPHQMGVDGVREFYVNEQLYRRYTVDIDRSSDELKGLSGQKKPDFKKETLFLQQLLRGRANLFLFKDEQNKRYFFNVDDESKADQLIYKRYYVNNHIAKNNRFREQLWSALRCETMTISNVRNLDYNKDDLMDYFEDYNSCVGADYEIVTPKKTSEMDVDLSLQPGMNFTSFDFENTAHKRTGDFSTEGSIHLGLELEFILPSSNQKWSVFLAPFYRQYEKEVMLKNHSSSGVINNEEISAKIDFKAIEIPIGFRRYFYINEKSSIFLNAQYALVLPMNSKVSFSNYKTESEMSTLGNFSFGTGFKYNKKYSLEFRYFFKTGVVSANANYNMHYSGYALILGYTVF